MKDDFVVNFLKGISIDGNAIKEARLLSDLEAALSLERDDEAWLLVKEEASLPIKDDFYRSCFGKRNCGRKPRSKNIDRVSVRKLGL